MKIIVVNWGQSMTVNDQKCEKWGSCVIEFFLFWICLGGDLIQK